jgi:hypothetical protein
MMKKSTFTQVTKHYIFAAIAAIAAIAANAAIAASAGSDNLIR